MTNKTILVTGGAGYVGSHACKELAARGFAPVVIDNLSRGHRWAVKWGPLEEGDIRDQAFLTDVFRRHEPIAVMHYAAFAYVGESVDEPELYLDNNVTGAETLLAAMRETTCRRFIFSSSCAVYGQPDGGPISEDTPRAPVNPYGEGKKAVEDRLSHADSTWGLRSVSLRYFNAAGSDPDTEIGEMHHPETHVIPRALAAAAGNDEAFRIYGTDFDTSDGTCIRDFIHVVDLADAHIRALDFLANGGETTRLNLGTGRGISVREIGDTVRRVTGQNFTIIEEARRPGDPGQLVADATKAKGVLGWAPKHAQIETQIHHAWAWYQGPGAKLAGRGNP